MGLLPSGTVMETLVVKVHVWNCHIPRDMFLPTLGLELGMRPLPIPGGLVLFPENGLCVGDVGEQRGSAVLGLAERFNGCVDPSSCSFKRTQ